MIYSTKTPTRELVSNGGSLHNFLSGTASGGMSWFAIARLSCDLFVSTCYKLGKKKKKIKNLLVTFQTPWHVSQSIFQEPPLSESLGKLHKYRFLNSSPDLRIQNAWEWGPQLCIKKKFSGWFLPMLKYENYCLMTLGIEFKVLHNCPIQNWKYDTSNIQAEPSEVLLKRISSQR